jgi:hypothetical protein
MAGGTSEVALDINGVEHCKKVEIKLAQAHSRDSSL